MSGDMLVCHTAAGLNSGTVILRVDNFPTFKSWLELQPLNFLYLNSRQI